MAYITSDYYINEFKGKQPSSQEDLDRLIERASDYIDILTQNKINDLDKMNPKIANQIKKATATLVEFYVLNGYDETIYRSGLSSASLGSFSLSFKENGNGEGNGKVPDIVIDLIAPTGLLYRGIDVEW